MIEAKTTDTNLDIINFDGQGPGLYKIIRGFDDSIIQEVLVMSVLVNTLTSLNKLLDTLSLDLKNDGIAGANAAKWNTIISGIFTIVALATAASFFSYSEVAEGAEATYFQRFHQFLISSGFKGQMLAQKGFGIAKAIFSLKQGRYTSDSEKIQAANNQLNPLVNSDQDTMNGNAQTINAEMKSIKEMLQNDYSSKTKGLYFYKN